MMAPFFVSHFCEYLQVEKRYSSHTIIAYQNDLMEFSSFISTLTLDSVTPKEVKGFVYFLKEQGLNNTSVNRKISTLRTFYKWMLRNKHINKDPLSKTTLLKQPKRLPNFVHEEDLTNEKLDAVFSSSSFTDSRDRLMFELFYQTGVRLSELIHIKLNDVQNNTIKVLGKRKKERIIPISKQLSELIEDYKKQRLSLQYINEYLLTLDNGNQMYAKFVYRKIHNLLAVLSNVQKKSPHVLRHTFATQLMEHGAGIESIKSLLGHSDLRATQIYTHSSITQLKNVYSQAHPRGKN